MKQFKYFEVTIPNTVDTATVAEGFIDNRAAESFATAPTNLTNSRTKEKANIRWQNIVFMLCRDSSCSNIINIVAAGDQDTAPTEISFTVEYPADQVVYVRNDNGSIRGPASVGGDGGTEAQAVRRAVALALSRSIATTNLSAARVVQNPTMVDSAVRNPFLTENVTINPFGGATLGTRVSNIEGIAEFTVVEVV